jgi:S1-C subfamily serine protease
MMKYVRELSGTSAALALLAGGALAQGASAGSVQPSKVMVATKDTAGRVNRMIILGSPLIDSLTKRLNNLPLGSAEFIEANAALEAAFRELPSPAAVGTYRIEITAPRAAMALRSPADVPVGTLGFTADGVNRPLYGPGGIYLQYFEYPTVVAIEANSPASRAGVQAGDLLLAYNGEDVRKNIINMTRLLTPGREVTVKLRRDGDLRDVMMTVERASPSLVAERRLDATRAMAPTPREMDERRAVEEQVVTARARAAVPSSTPRATVMSGGSSFSAVAPAMNGVLGAAMTDVDSDLAGAISGMEGKRGVLLTRVPAGSLAARTGLRGGDVILRVDASDVATVAQFRVRIALAEQSGQEKVKLSILRAGKIQEITYYTR